MVIVVLGPRSLFMAGNGVHQNPVNSQEGRQEKTEGRLPRLLWNKRSERGERQSARNSPDTRSMQPESRYPGGNCFFQRLASVLFLNNFDHIAALHKQVGLDKQGHGDENYEEQSI